MVASDLHVHGRGWRIWTTDLRVKSKLSVTHDGLFMKVTDYFA